MEAQQATRDATSSPATDPGRRARYVAIITDGNGRWAKRRGLPVIAGHEAGADVVKARLRDAVELGVRELTVYSFSTENWSRDDAEVAGLMAMFRRRIELETPELHAEGVRMRFLGRRAAPVAPELIEQMEWAEQVTAGNTRITLFVAFNYGGRAEIVDAAAAIAADVAAGKLRAEKIDEKGFARYLDEPAIPEVDLFVRSSGEQRLSNFLLWQSAYAELVFLDTLWPDFDRRHLWHACEIYASRDRRYGGALPNPVRPNPVAPPSGA